MIILNEFQNFFIIFFISYYKIKVCSLSCVKTQKITNLLTLGQIKSYMGSVKKNSKKKIKILIFECAKLDFCKKKIASAKKILFF